MKGAYTDDYYYRLKNWIEELNRGGGIPLWFSAPFSGNFWKWEPQDAATTEAALLRDFYAHFQHHHTETIMFQILWQNLDEKIVQNVYLILIIVL